MAGPSFSISIGLDSKQVKSNLETLQQEFRQATAGINAALKDIRGFQRLKREISETSSAYQAAQQKVAELARLVDAGAVGGEIAAEFERAKEAAAELKEALTGQQEKLQQLRKNLADAGISTTNLVEPQKELKQALSTVEQEYQSLSKIANARDVLGVRPHTEIQAKISATRQALAELKTAYQEGRITSQEWAQAQTHAARQIEALGARTNGVAKQLQDLKLAWAGTVAAVTGLAMGLKSGIDQFVQFDDAMLKVQALSKATGDDFDLLKQRARELGATTRFTATEAAQGMSELAATGMDVQEIYETLPAAMDMAAISGMGVKDSADKVTDIMTQFNLEADRATHVVDVLTQGYTGASTSMEELGQAMVYVGPLANSVGYTLEETTAILQALAESGYKGQKAGTALRGGFARLLNPVGEAKAIIQRYNLQVSNSDGTMRKFADILDDVGKAGLSSAEQIQLFGQEAGPGMVALLAKGGDAVRNFEAGLQDVDGKARDVAGKLEEGIGGAMRRLDAATSAIVISFGETFAPLLSRAADAASWLASGIADLPGPIKMVVGFLAAGGASFVVWKAGLGAIITSIHALPRALQALTASEALAEQNARRLQAELAKVGPIASRSFAQATAATTAFNQKLGQTGAISVGASGGMGKLTGALTKLANVGLAFQAGWFIGDMLNEFDVFRKAGATLIYSLDRIRLAAVKTWRVLTGGDVADINRQIEAAKEAHLSLLEDIEKGQDDWSKKKRGELSDKNDTSTGGGRGGRLGIDDQEDAAAQEQRRQEALADDRREREQAIDEELADKRQQRQEQAFDEELKRRQRLDDQAAQGEDNNAAWRNYLEEQRAALEDTHENRLAIIDAEAQAAFAAHQNVLAQIKAEADERKKAHQQQLEDIRAEQEDLKDAHEEKLSMIAEEIEAARQAGDDKAVAAAEKKRDKEETAYGKESARLEREARRAQEAEARAKQDDQRKITDAQRSYSAESSKIALKARQELAAEEKRQAERRRQDEEAASRTAEEKKEKRQKEAEEARAEEEEKRRKKAEKKRAHEATSYGDAASGGPPGEAEWKKAEKSAEASTHRVTELQRQRAETQIDQIDRVVEAQSAAADERVEQERRATGKMQELFRSYADKVSALSEDMSERSKSLAEDLIDLDPLASEEEKWRMRAELAAEYEEQAKAAMAAGNLEDALKLSGQARAAYKELKAGGEGVNEKLAANTAYQGVRAAGELSASIEKLMAEQIKKQAVVDLGPAGAAITRAAEQLSDAAGKQGQQPTKVVELKFQGGSLRGDEEAVNALIRQLEQAGMMA